MKGAAVAPVLRRELRRIARDAIYRWLLVGLPILSFALIVLLFDKGVARNVPIAVADEDRTPLSRQLVQMFDASPTAEVSFQPASSLECERLMREGRIMAFVRIPSGFERQVLGGRPAAVESRITGTNISVNGLLARDLQSAVTTFSAGVQLRLLTAAGLSTEAAEAQLMPVRFHKHVLFNPWLNYGYYLVPGFLPMMLLILAALSTVYAVGIELREGSAAEWLRLSGGSVVAALAGKLLPVTGMMLLWGGVMLFVEIAVVGVPLNGSLGMLALATLLLVLAYQAVAVTVVALTANLRLALSLCGGYSVLSFSFSGLTFPLMAMWAPARWLSYLFPFTYYMQVVIDQLLRGAPAAVSGPPLLGLLLFLLLPAGVLPHLRRLCTEEKYWGKI